jgi:hypothetical protein
LKAESEDSARRGAARAACGGAAARCQWGNITLEGKALVTPFGWNIKAESEDSARGPAAKPRPAGEESGPNCQCDECPSGDARALAIMIIIMMARVSFRLKFIHACDILLLMTRNYLLLPSPISSSRFDLKPRPGGPMASNAHSGAPRAAQRRRQDSVDPSNEQGD